MSANLSYASSAKSRGGHALIRCMENATGRIKLIRCGKGYEQDINQENDFWQVIIRRYGVSLDIVRGSLENIPKEGPLILVSNHPFGVLDGLIMGHILSQRRAGEFNILAHKIFHTSEELKRVTLPISFAENKDALRLNLSTRKKALSYLADGGAIGVFPGGTVSTSMTLFSRPLDPGWRGFTAKMIARSDACVVPMFFEGTNSRLFQIGSHLHPNLRSGLLIREFKKRARRPVRLAIGEPVQPAALHRFRQDPKACMDFLRKATYELAQQPGDCTELGYEVDEKYKG